MSVGFPKSTTRADSYQGSASIGKQLKSNFRQGMAKLDKFASKHNLPQFAHAGLNQLPNGFPGKSRLQETLNRLIGGNHTSNPPSGFNTTNHRPHHSQYQFQHAPNGNANSSLHCAPPKQTQSPGQHLTTDADNPHYKAHVNPSILQHPQPKHQNADAFTGRNKLMDAVARFEKQAEAGNSQTPTDKPLYVAHANDNILQHPQPKHQNADSFNGSNKLMDAVARFEQQVGGHTTNNNSQSPSLMIDDHLTASPSPLHSSASTPSNANPIIADRFTESPDLMSPSFADRYTESPDLMSPSFDDRYTESPEPMTGSSIDSYGSSQNYSRNDSYNNYSYDSDESYNPSRDPVIADRFTESPAPMSPQEKTSGTTPKDSGDYFSQQHHLHPLLDDALKNSKPATQSNDGDYFNQKHDSLDASKAKPRMQVDDYFNIPEFRKN